jgi:hypothetical protein
MGKRENLSHSGAGMGISNESNSIHQQLHWDPDDKG